MNTLQVGAESSWPIHGGAATSWLSVPPLAVLAMIVFWLVKLHTAKLFNRFSRKRHLRRQEAAAAACLG